MPAVTARGDSTSCPILVIVGTDHHPFDRLIGWINEWLASHQELADRCFVQSGTASVRPACQESQFLEVDLLSTLLDAAEVIICHGGPGSISDAWDRGRKPIVIPRLARFGEVVDDHQVDFCEKLAELGKVSLARTLPEFTAQVDEALSDPSRFRVSSSSSAADAAITRLGELVNELLSRPGRLPLIGRRPRTGRDPSTGTGDPAGHGDLSPEIIPAVSTNWQAPRNSLRSGLAVTVKEEQE